MLSKHSLRCNYGKLQTKTPGIQVNTQINLSADPADKI
jgi:hypothetical protein